MSQGRPFRVMTEDEQADQIALEKVVRSCISVLRLTRCQHEDVRVALARLENWLSENDGRWTVDLRVADAFTPPDPFSRKV